MADPIRWKNRDGIQRALELLFALEFALVAVWFAFMASPPLTDRFAWLESYIRVRLLHMRPTDFINGGIAFWLPSLALGLCIWVLLRLSGHTRFVRGMLRYVPGFVAMFSLPAFWLRYKLPGAAYHSGVPIEAFHWGAPIEVAVAVYCGYRFARSRWPIPAGRSIALLTLHFAYWFVLVRSDSFWPLTPLSLHFAYRFLLACSYAGPGILGRGAAIVSYGCCLAWAVYVWSLKSSTSIKG